MSFRDRVLDALNITKQHINLPVETKFVVTTPTGVVGDKPYALSKRVLEKEIGNDHKRTLDVLGFQVGDAHEDRTTQVLKSDNVTDLCLAVERPYPLCSYATVANGTTTYTDTGFHPLSGMYEAGNIKLQSMRKSAIPSNDLFGTHAADPAATVNDHVHTEWPSVLSEQLKLLNEQPYADSLYYHDMKLRFMITGVDNPDNNADLPRASNHRGLVRMVILRPLSRRARLRHEGSTNTPMANFAYAPNWETDLFFSKKRMLGGAIDANMEESDPYGDIVKSYGLPASTAVKGLRRSEDEIVNQNSKDVHFGHIVPVSTMGVEYDLSPFQVMTSPINRKDYAVIVDKSFHLDIQHHGVGSQRVENVTIPFRMKARFAGRKAGAQVPYDDNETVNIADDIQFADAQLLDETLDEPLNMNSKPIIMFMAMDQKLSIEVEGYTSISEC